MSRRRRRSVRQNTPGAEADSVCFVSTRRLAELTGLSHETLWRYRRAGGLEIGVHYVRIGRRLLWHLDNFRHWQRSLGLANPDVSETADSD